MQILRAPDFAIRGQSDFNSNICNGYKTFCSPGVAVIAIDRSIRPGLGPDLQIAICYSYGK